MKTGLALDKIIHEIMNACGKAPAVLYIPDEMYGLFHLELSAIQRIKADGSDGSGIQKLIWHSTEIRSESAWKSEQKDLGLNSGYRRKFERLLLAIKDSEKGDI